MPKLKKAAIIGGGVIGGGWAARLILNGIDVHISDPDPEAPRKLEAVMANAERAHARLWSFSGATVTRGKLTHASSIGEAVSGADLIQESAPERLDIKKRVHAEIGEAASKDSVIASSTSGLLPTEIQQGTARADRVMVAHPYNPVYLLPVVEIVGGQATSSDAIEKAMDIYASIGMKPIKIEKEIDAFVGDRILEAMWRESIWLVEDGIATVETIDDIVRYGLGLRYAQMGQFMTYRLAGGEAGMRHFLDQFGPSLAWPWTKLMDVPAWTDELIDKITEQSDDQAKGQSIRALEEIRDNNLVDILKALKKNNWGAGALLKDPAEDQQAEINLPEGSVLETWQGQVDQDWTDYNGHMTESRYLEVFSMATDKLLIWIGAGPAYIKQGGSWYTLETHIRHLDEVGSGDKMRVETQIIDHDIKRLHLHHHLYAEDNRLLATGEHMLIHVDMKEGRPAPMPADMQTACDALASRQADMAKPESVGASIGMRRK